MMYTRAMHLTTAGNNSSERPSSIPDPRCDWIAKFLRYRTDDLLAARTHLRALDDSIRLNVSNPRGFRGYREALHVPIGSLALTIGCIDAIDGYELAFQTRDEYIINMPLRGSGRISAGGASLELTNGNVLLLVPCCRVVKHWHGPGHSLCLHIPKQAMVSALRDRGMNPQSLRLDAAMVFARREMPSFLRSLNMICAELADGGTSLQEPVIACHYERLLTSLLIDCLPRNVRDSQRRTLPAAPHYVQRAEDYVRANVMESLNTAEIAAAAGVSARALQYAFRRYRDTTPTLFLKRVRLERARALLLNAVVRPRVSDVAAGIGCYNNSQFSRDYKDMFGETPSQTVAAHRMLASGAQPTPMRGLRGMKGSGVGGDWGRRA